MLKKAWLYFLFFFAINALEGNEIYSLKKSYEVDVFIDGTDQTSIKEGMQKGLSKLLISLSGNSDILENRAIQTMLISPENYISQYKLESEDQKIIGTFLFQGDSVRSYLSDNELPLWLSDKPLILIYFPCSQIQEEIIQLGEKEKCLEIEKELLTLSSSRNSKITRPLMDLRDIRDLNILNSISSERFMTKISKRYVTENWLTCLVKDKFGLLMDIPACISSKNLEFSSLNDSFNDLLNKINLKKSLIVDKSKINISKIKVTGVNSFLVLEKILETLNSQVLTFDVSLDELEGDVASISLSHYGDKVDLNNLLIIHSNFKKIKSKSQDIISYNYIKS